MANGFSSTAWRGDGKVLFYFSPDRKVMGVPVKTGTNFNAGAPAVLPEPVLPLS